MNFITSAIPGKVIVQADCIMLARRVDIRVQLCVAREQVDYHSYTLMTVFAGRLHRYMIDANSFPEG